MEAFKRAWEGGLLSSEGEAAPVEGEAAPVEGASGGDPTPEGDSGGDPTPDEKIEDLSDIP